VVRDVARDEPLDERAGRRAERGRRVLVLPRAKQRFSFGGRAQLALMEVCGVAILNEASAYDAASPTAVGGTELEAELRAFSLPAEAFAEIVEEEVAAGVAAAAAAQ